MKKDIKKFKKLELHRESLRGLDLQVVSGGTPTQGNTCHLDCTFVYTGCTV